MQDPSKLYALGPVRDMSELQRPVLLHVFNGFMDAGAGARVAAEHLLASLPHEAIAEFDIDQLLDYRARRPAMTFVENRYESYSRPRLTLFGLKDLSGRPFLLLHGFEPDTQWERFCAAVIELIEKLDVSLSVGLSAFPFPAPHTRPLAVTTHANDPTLVRGTNSWVGELEVPASIGALLQVRLGEAGHKAMGYAVHVPHYVAQFEFPAVAVSLLYNTMQSTDLVFPLDDLRVSADRASAEVNEQLAANPENAEVVVGLEEQYDAFRRGSASGLPLSEAGELPTADEIAAEFERFLSQQDPGNPGRSAD